MSEEYEDVLLPGTSVSNSGQHRARSAPPAVATNMASFGFAPFTDTTDSPSNNVADQQLRASLEYYKYYHSQKPIDPRLPPPLYDWSAHVDLHADSDFLQRFDNMGIQDGQRAMDPNSNLYYSEEGVGLLPHREEDESWSHGVVEGAGEGQGNVSKASGKESEKHASGLPNLHKSVIDRIQEDFPRTPSPVFALTGGVPPKPAHSKPLPSPSNKGKKNMHVIESEIREQQRVEAGSMNYRTLDSSKMTPLMGALQDSGFQGLNSGRITLPPGMQQTLDMVQESAEEEYSRSSDTSDDRPIGRHDSNEAYAGINWMGSNMENNRMGNLGNVDLQHQLAAQLLLQQQQQQQQQQQRKRRGQGRTRSAFVMAGLGTAVLATPVVALTLKAKTDPEGFTEGVKAVLPPPLASSTLTAFGVSSKPPPPTTTTKLVAPVSAPPPPSDALPLPASLKKESDGEMIEHARRAAKEQQERIESAAAALMAEAAALQEKEAERKRMIEKELQNQLDNLNSAMVAISERNKLIREQLNQAEVQQEKSRVIFQETHLGDVLREQMEQIEAGHTAAKIIDELQKHHADVLQAQEMGNKIDVSSEKSLQQGASIAQARARLRDLLFELDSRTKLESMRLREAMKQTEETAKLEGMKAMQEQLIAHEREIQRLMDEQVSAVNGACQDEITRRGQQFEQKMKEEWDAVAIRGDELSSLRSRMREVQKLLKSEYAIDELRNELAARYKIAANARMEEAEDLILRLQVLDKTLEQSKNSSDWSRNMQSIFLAVENASKALKEGEFHQDLAVIQALANVDPLVQTAVRSIPTTLRDVPSHERLQQGLEEAIVAARKQLLVPAGSGFVGEAWAAAASRFLRPFSDVTLPNGEGEEVRLRRARVFLRKGDLEGAVKELGYLSPSTAKPMESWMLDARKVLVLRQALTLIRAHALSSLSASA